MNFGVDFPPLFCFENPRFRSFVQALTFGYNRAGVVTIGVSILSENVKEARQLYLFDDTEVITGLDARLWHGSFNSRESTLQQLSPYAGKMKSGMARVLMNLYRDHDVDVRKGRKCTSIVPTSPG